MVAEKFQQHKSQMVPHSQTGTQPNRGMLETKQRHHTSQPHLSNIRSHEERDLKNSEDEEIQVGHSQLLMLVTIDDIFEWILRRAELSLENHHR